MCLHNGFCAFVLAAFFFFANALSSVPVATDPILVTATIPTVVPSLVTVYSVVPATDATPGAATIITTTINGAVTTFTSTEPIAGSVTSTIISTISLTTNQVVVSTVGFSTVFGPDPTTPIVSSISTTALPTSPTSSTVSSVSDTAATALSNDQTNSPVATVTRSSTATSSVSPTSTSTAVGANGSSTASSSSSHAKGLSSGAKAGIGIGVGIGVILLVGLSFLLGQRYSRRRNNVAGAKRKEAAAGEKDTFQAGRPYETTGPQYASPALTAGKSHAYSLNTTAVGSGSPSVGRQSFDAPNSPRRQSHYDDAELSALPPITKEDDQMYVGVPTHMSGSKRWSMKEFMR
ncbi:hypothetical protein H2200_011859 [Cladophialophora chaetospira]|uniref:Mid2 domain-containing protein n=1 Tax=Cladophialophora chaetospira TaxID=386627 RepID=A0AA38WYZ0_9EURO|nr:hypothetical protein H2200_011859 [Cladophialophora chaetospira]